MKTSFQILDLDRDGKMNILNLLHLHKNIPSNSLLGAEIFKVF
jgi:Ca2+-binding EF-hand superfamily protein